jgi:hypothetical protein
MNMATPHFDVFISGATSSVEDWRKAMSARKAELPKLNQEQKEVARKMGISEEEFARGVLVTQYGENRQRERGQSLGRQIEEILSGLGEPYRLEALIREGVKLRWVARIITPHEAKNIAIGQELADDIIDSCTVQDLDLLRVLILESLNRKDLIGSLQ